MRVLPGVRFHPAARAEIRDARRWYEGEVRGLGRAFLGEGDATLAFIARHPAMYEAVEADGSVRRALLHRFPYALIYEVVPGGGATVLACRHMRGDPAPGWSSRR